MTIGGCEIRGCHQCECHLHREENANVDKIALGVSAVLTLPRIERCTYSGREPMRKKKFQTAHTINYQNGNRVGILENLLRTK